MRRTQQRWNISAISRAAPACSGLLTAGRVLSMMSTMTDNSPFMFSESLCARLAGGPVYCLGRAGMDLYPEPAGVITEEAEQFRADMGGSKANIAVALSRQGGVLPCLRCFQMIRSAGL